MHIPVEWDRPTTRSNGASYYPLLRFPGLTDADSAKSACGAPLNGTSCIDGFSSNGFCHNSHASGNFFSCQTGTALGVNTAASQVSPSRFAHGVSDPVALSTPASRTTHFPCNSNLSYRDEKATFNNNNAGGINGHNLANRVSGLTEGRRQEFADNSNGHTGSGAFNNVTSSPGFGGRFANAGNQDGKSASFNSICQGTAGYSRDSRGGDMNGVNGHCVGGGACSLYGTSSQNNKVHEQDHSPSSSTPHFGTSGVCCFDGTSARTGKKHEESTATSFGVVPDHVSSAGGPSDFQAGGLQANRGEGQGLAPNGCNASLDYPALSANNTREDRNSASNGFSGYFDRSAGAISGGDRNPSNGFRGSFALHASTSNGGDRNPPNGFSGSFERPASCAGDRGFASNGCSGSFGRPTSEPTGCASAFERGIASSTPSGSQDRALASSPVDDRGMTSRPNATSSCRAASVPPPEPAIVATPSVPFSADPKVEVEVKGEGELPGPWMIWDSISFPTRLRAPLISAGFPAPTIVQQYAWPILSMGRDLIGIAKTGSGKTLAFLMPAFSQLLSDGRADARGPPSILVLAPTRELAVQIEQQAKQFGSIAGMRAVCLYGGAPKGPQLAEMRTRPQAVVATPGRLNDLLDPPPGLTKGVDVGEVRYLVLDEADRMLDMGFEPQIRKIINALPNNRQTAMFTATWPASVRRLATEFIKNAVEVRVGEVDELVVNADIEQRVVFCTESRDKEERALDLLRDAGNDQAIVFVNTKRMCEVVAMRIQNSVAIHGDKDQRERDTALGLFKSGNRRVLVATDVAARGLDVSTVRLVINFDPPNRDEDYVHRVGRTGRAGKKGQAVTLLTNDDGTAARFIADIFKRGGLTVPGELERRLASGEMRTGGGGGRNRTSSQMRIMPSSRRSFGGGGAFTDDFDFADTRPSFGGGRDFGGRNEFSSNCLTDCPT